MSDPQAHGSPLLRADGLSKVYPDGNVHALRGVSLEVDAASRSRSSGPADAARARCCTCSAASTVPPRARSTFEARR